MSILIVVSGSSKDFLKKEIAAIQELLDEQPDAKCKIPYLSLQGRLTVHVGCMESIVHYKRMLVKQCGDPKERDSLAEDCQSLLKRLIDIDPFRRQRYHELCTYSFFRLKGFLLKPPSGRNATSGQGRATNIRHCIFTWVTVMKEIRG